MNGAVKVKLLAAVVIAILAVSAVSITFMIPSNDTLSEEETVPEVISANESVQSESLQMLMMTLNMCHFYIGKADVSQYDKVYGDGDTMYVGETVVLESVLLNSGATVDFSKCKKLIMGKDLCINGTGIKFVSDDDAQFEIVFLLGSNMMIGPNISLGRSATITSTPFTISYEGKSSLFDEEGELKEELKVDCSVSIDLDDDVRDGMFTFSQQESEGNKKINHEYSYTDTTYKLANRIDEEVDIDLKCDFTEYYKSLSESEQTEIQENSFEEMKSFSFTDWFSYYFLEDHIIPDADISFILNGLTMNVDYEYRYITAYKGNIPSNYFGRDGTFMVSDISNLEFQVESSNKDKYQKVAAEVDNLEYVNTYTDTKYECGRLTFPMSDLRTSSSFTEEEKATVDNLDFSMVESSANEGRTTILLKSKSITLYVLHDHDTYDDTTNSSLSALNVKVEMNREHVKDLYEFIIQVFSGEDTADTVMNADYAAILCDAVIDASCANFNVQGKHFEYALDSENKMNYVPLQTSNDISIGMVVFNCDYYEHEEAEMTFDSMDVVSNEKQRWMDYAETGKYAGKYVPTLSNDDMTITVGEFSLESEFTLTSVNTIMKYFVTLAIGEDVSGIDLRGIDTELSISDVSLIETMNTCQAQVGKESSKWEKYYNDNEELFPTVIDKAHSEIKLTSFRTVKSIDSTQREIGFINLDIVSADVTESSDNYYDKDMVLKSEISAIYCTINSERPKLIAMVVDLIRGMSNEQSAESMDSFLSAYIFDGTDLEMSMALNKLSLDYESTIYGEEELQNLDELHLLFGDDGQTSEDKTITVSMDLNAGNASSGVGYHNSSIKVAMTDGSSVGYSLTSYSAESGTNAEEYNVTGLNGEVSIDSVINAKMTMVSSLMYSKAGYSGSNSSSTKLTQSDISVDVTFEYDRVSALHQFIDQCIDSTDITSTLESAELDTLLKGMHIFLKSGKETYSLDSEMSYSDTNEKKYTTSLDHSDYLISNYVMEVNYLTDEFVSVGFEHVNSTSYSYCMKRVKDSVQTEYSTTYADMYNLGIRADTDLSGLDNFIRYAKAFIAGDLSKGEDKLDEYFDMSIHASYEGKSDAHEYEMKETTYGSNIPFETLRKNSSVYDSYITSTRDITADFDIMTFDIIFGTSGVESISAVLDSLSMEYVYEADGGELDVVLNVDYIEFFIGTGSKSLFKLAMVVYTNMNDLEGLDDEIRSALVSFVTDKTNTRLQFKITYGEFYIKDNRSGNVGTQYTISVPKSGSEKYALSIDGSLKIQQTDDLYFTMDGTYFKMDMADDSKITYSNGYGDNIYLEYFELANLDASVKVTAIINPNELVNYLGDNEAVISHVLDSIKIKGIITADSGKYTSIRTDTKESTYYKYQASTNVDLKMRIDTVASNLMSAETLPQTVFIEGGDASITSEYTDSKGTVREIFLFEEFTAYMDSGEFIVGSESVDAYVNLGNVTYNMKTDGSVYFNNSFPSLKGYSIVKNGVTISEDGFGIAPTIRVSTFTVKEDSELYKGMTFIKGTELALTADKGRSDFAGWRVNDTLVPCDKGVSTVYYAPMDDEVTISYVYGCILIYKSSDNDDASSVLRSVVMEAGDSIDLSYTPTKTGFVFQKWNTNFTTMPAYNLSIVAIWVPNTYKLTIDRDNGSEKQVIVMSYDSPISNLTDPTKTGYEFVGWSNYKENMVMPAYDLTIKALWSCDITSKSIIQEESGAKINVGADVAKIALSTVNELYSLSSSKASLDISFTGASISMDDASIKKLFFNEITGEPTDVKMSVTKSDIVSETVLKTMADEDKERLSNVRYAVSINVNTSGNTSGLGEVKVRVPVDSSYAGSTFIVYYISDDGEMTEYEADCETEDGQTFVSFYTDHFSYFALSQTGSAVEQTEESSSSHTWIYIVIAVACVLIIGLIVFAILKRNYII